MSQLSQQEKETIIDILLVLMYSDNKIKLDEQQFLDKAPNILGWESKIDAKFYIDRSIGNIRRLAPNEIENFLESATSKLKSKEAKEKAIKFAKQICEIDGEIDYREQKSLGLIMASLR